MMRALWSGVSGLQAHQIAMDVEGDNIANVNTVGFKYGRVSFSDIFSQTSKAATAPQGELGGKNPMQIGLGTQINAVTKIFKQGSIQTTEGKTDLAIQGNGFFIISPDGGKTNYYTRNGDFSMDSLGNFVDKNGYTVQGWLRNPDTGFIDPATPLKPIKIEPGLNTPARASTYIAARGNLNSGNNVGEQKTAIYSLDEFHGWVDLNGDRKKQDDELINENDTSLNKFYTDKAKVMRLQERGVDLGILFNDSGEAMSIRDGQGMWVSYADAKATFGERANPPTFNQNTTLHISINGIEISPTKVSNLSEIVSKINSYSDKTGVSASVINGNQIQLVNQNNNGTTESMKNIKVRKFENDNTIMGSVNIITAYKYAYSAISSEASHAYNDSVARVVHSTEDLRAAMQEDARNFVNYKGTSLGDGMVRAINAALAAVGNSDSVNNKDSALNVLNTHIGTVTDANQQAALNRIKDYFNANSNATNKEQALRDLRAAAATETTADKLASYTADEWANTQNIKEPNRNDGVSITVNKKGQFVIQNPAGDSAFTDGDTNGTDSDSSDNTANPAGGLNQPVNNETSDNDNNLVINITALSDPGQNISENTKFSSAFASLNGALSSGTSDRTSQSMFMSSHSMSTEIYDSLGSKHEVKIMFNKTGYSPENGTDWSMIIQVPEPAVINTKPGEPSNIITGTMRFKPDGSILGFNPTNLTFTANNGSEPGQNIELLFGNNAQSINMGGISSYDSKSSTDDIKQDGYTGGVLDDIRINENGTIIGIFTNGRSFGLAQVGLASFTNNEGLESMGGNLFAQSANSGSPVIGAAQTAGKGKINASSLEMSNVDLSRSLTQLIVVQRGYQANSKTITTSDQMLNTLLQLKQ